MIGIVSGRLAAVASWLLVTAAVALGFAIAARVHLYAPPAAQPPAAAAPTPAPPPPPCGMADPGRRPELAADCAVLLRIKDALRGEGHLNWRASLAIAEWDGVALTGGGRRVARLDLEGRGFTGSIPPALGELTGLTALRLDGNRLTGELPAALAGLPQLRELRVDGNALTGCIPPALRARWESGLAALGLPDCTCDRGRAAPAGEPGLAADCAILMRAKDRLRGEAPLNWSPALAMEDWDGVGLTERAPRRVDGIHLRNHGLTGVIPAGLGGLTELTYLHLGAENYLTGPIPPELANLAKLTQFYAGGRNRLTGELPAGFGNLTRLTTLYLSHNLLTGDIPDLSRTRLVHLNLVGNRFTGGIPPWLGGVSTLERLNLGGNLLTGGIPATLGALPLLREVALGGNALTGCIPAPLRDAERHDLDELGLPDCP